MTKLTRAQIGRGVLGIDTTVKSAQGIWRPFAPRWEMVMGIKSGKISETQYTEQYDQILDAVPTNVWNALAAQPENTLLCFCKSSSFCHSHLIIEYAVKHWPDRFQDGRDTQQIPPLFLHRW